MEAASNVHLFSKDASTGDSKSIFNILLTDGANLEDALCPPGMKCNDCAGFASWLLDVTAIPGTNQQISFALEKTDTEAMMEGTVALVAQATGNS